MGSQALIDKVCNKGRFTKVIAAVLKQARNSVRNGLGTTHSLEERNWGIAHRILAPHFALLAVKNMFSNMHDIASQLVLKWARHRPKHNIYVTEDFTRLTLDTITLSAIDYRFNSFYKGAMHPFINALVSFLTSIKAVQRGALCCSCSARLRTTSTGGASNSCGRLATQSSARGKCI
jgi:cytochrome P450/NADPH-cytochrome P450 reductase